ncbi:MAG: DNA mismatch endonuclease Vsr [Chloroflexi bacterium]|nr:DNA mismatch endonuclease Vsr [Chloroflexota bacterium]
MKVRSLLHRRGFRFRLHRKDLPGQPDIVLPRYRTVIFVNGCFWHQHPGCKKATIPQNNHEFWKEKLERNILRDKEQIHQLEQEGWRVIITWECDIKEDIELVIDNLVTQLKSD